MTKAEKIQKLLNKDWSELTPAQRKLFEPKSGIFNAEGHFRELQMERAKKQRKIERESTYRFSDTQRQWFQDVMASMQRSFTREVLRDSAGRKKTKPRRTK